MGSTSKISMNSMTLTKWFWNDDIWLPPNVTWTDLEQSEMREGVAVPKFSHLWYPIPASLIVIAIRYAVERYAFKHLHYYFNPHVCPSLLNTCVCLCVSHISSFICILLYAMQSKGMH